jgi:hypothetical protein
MLANAIFLPDSGSVDRRFRNTEVYFDTSFLIYALGYAGQPRRDPCIELLNLLYETGAELRCFRHTYDEVQGALRACANRLARGAVQDAYGPSIEYFLAEGLTSSDVELIINRLERDLRSLRVKVEDEPPYIPKFVVNERGLADALRNAIHYRTDGPLDRDVASLSGVMRLRGTASYFYVEECHAVFVTTNPVVARTAWNFFMSNATPGSVSPCLTDYNLTNLLWLKKPLHAPELPRKRLIADCYAATQPDDHLWKRYIEEIGKLQAAGKITSEDVLLLRHSLEARRALMERTLGEEAAFVEATVPEILRVVRASIEARLQTQVDEEAARREMAESALQVQQLKADQTSRTLREQAQEYAAGLIALLKWGFFVLLGLATVYAFPWKLPTFSSAWFRYLLSFVQVFILLVSSAQIYWGTSVKTRLRMLENRLSRRIEGFLGRLVGIETTAA